MVPQILGQLASRMLFLALVVLATACGPVPPITPLATDVQPERVEGWCQSATKLGTASSLVELAAGSIQGKAAQLGRQGLCVTTAAVMSGAYACLDYYDRIRGGAGVVLPTTVLDLSRCDLPGPPFDAELPGGLVLVADAVFDAPQGGLLLGRVDETSPPAHDLACNAIETARFATFSVMLEFTAHADGRFSLPGISAQPGACAAQLRAREAARLQEFAQLETSTGS